MDGGSVSKLPRGTRIVSAELPNRNTSSILDLVPPKSIIYSIVIKTQFSTLSQTAFFYKHSSLNPSGAFWQISMVMPPAGGSSVYEVLSTPVLFEGGLAGAMGSTSLATCTVIYRPG